MTLDTKLNFFLIGLFISVANCFGCSMYKITVGECTMVGCNEDAWRTTSTLWFETAKSPEEFGAAFTGSRKVSEFVTAPQSGMNEKGLCFSRLAAYHPIIENTFSNRKRINNEVDFLTSVLHQCESVEEVEAFYKEYDHRFFIDDVLIYIDSAGGYLIVEPYQLLRGDEAVYVLSNFCPSITNNEAARNLGRYRKGEDYLAEVDLITSFEFCEKVSDTMHVCRERNGDGTLLTSIWDLSSRKFNLYFYHDFEHAVQFDLLEMLDKGDSQWDIPKLFPENEEFLRLKTYYTPFNTPFLRVSLVLIAAFLLLFTGAFVLHYLKTSQFTLVYLFGFSLTNVILIAYLFVLATTIGVYYFDAPFFQAGNYGVNVLSFTPFYSMVLMIILLRHFVRHRTAIQRYMRYLIFTNLVLYMVLVCGFMYWGLYDVFH